MKRLSTFLALGCIIAMSLTSCLKDDDNDKTQGLTKAQISQCYNAIVGSYTGKMIYPSYDSGKQVYVADTIDISWRVGTDTILTVNSVPAAAIAGTITENDLRKALEEQNPAADVKCYIGFSNLDSYVRFYLAPQKVEFPVYYQEKTHSVTALFWYNPYYTDTQSLGYKDLTNDLLACQLLLGAVYLDGNETRNFIGSGSATRVPLIFATDIKKATTQQTN